MKTVCIERSTGSARDGTWQEELDLEGGVVRFIIGTGPGSFAGIRSALAFALGYAAGRPGCSVLGLPSPAALVEKEGPFAVVGDARRGLFWIALFDDFSFATPIFQTTQDELEKRVPAMASVVSPDDSRIGAILKETFGERYLGERLPTADGLKRFAERSPESLVENPLPVYLNPAVRK